MGYTPQTWVNGSGGGTPLNATRLTHMESGLAGAGGRGSRVLVAASNSSNAAKAAANYVCDGVADDVQLQAALDLPQQRLTMRTDFTQADGSYDTVTPFIFPSQGTSNTIVSNKVRLNPQTGAYIRPFDSARDEGRIKTEITVTTFDWVGAVAWKTTAAGDKAYGYFLVLDTGLNTIVLYRNYNTSGGWNNTWGTALATVSTTLNLNTPYTVEVDFTGNVVNFVKLNGTTIMSNVNGYDASHDLTSSVPTYGATEFYRLFTPVLGTPGGVDYNYLEYDVAARGGVVELADGDYSLDDTITITQDHARLVSRGGACLSPSPAFTPGDPMILMQSGINQRVDGLSFTSLIDAPAVVGVKATRFNNLPTRSLAVVENCEFHFFRGNPVWIHANDCIVKNNTFRLCFDGHVIRSDWFTYQITGNHIREHNAYINGYYHPDNTHDTEAAIYCTETGEGLIAGNHITQCRNGIWVTDAQRGYDGELTITGNYIGDSGGIDTGYGMYLEYQFGAVVTGNTIVEGNYEGFVTNKCDQLVIVGNEFAFNDLEGVLMKGARDCLFSGNVVADNNDGGYQMRLTHADGATPDISVDNTVKDNLFRENQPYDATGHNSYYGNLPTHGLRIDAGTTGTWVVGNDGRRAGATGFLSDAGTSTDTTTYGNKTS